MRHYLVDISIKSSQNNGFIISANYSVKKYSKKPDLVLNYISTKRSLTKTINSIKDEIEFEITDKTLSNVISLDPSIRKKVDNILHYLETYDFEETA